MEPIKHGDIRDWAENTGNHPTPGQIDLIILIDSTFRAQFARFNKLQAQTKGPPPNGK